MSIALFTSGLVKKNDIWYAEKKAAVSYPEDGNELCFQIEDNSFWFRHRNNCIVELVKKYASDRLFFDIGGGNGFVAKAIENASIETVLVEPGEQGCINGRKRNLKNIICSTLEDAGFKKDSIPAAGIFDVMEHFENDMKLLKSINDYLQKDGLLFITVPAYRVLWSKEDTDGGHFHRYTLGSLSKKLNAAGYKVEYQTYIFSILPLPIFMFRTIPSLLHLNQKPSDIAKNKNEHKSESSLINSIWSRELNRIKNNKTIPFGGSCLVVARKK
jgi:SAM-dependent methyltransferase